MNGPDFTPAKLTRLIDEGRPHEGLVLFLERIGSKSFWELSGAEPAMLDIICSKGLAELLEHRTLWMVNHSDYLHTMLKLLTAVLQAGYHPATTLDHIAWLRCLLAIGEAMDGRIERVHQHLCLVQDTQPKNSIPQPDGTFRQQIDGVSLTEGSTTGFLEHFFDAYTQFLRRNGRYELGNFLETRLKKLIDRVARDERRPGVVQALLYDQAHGYSRFVHVSIEYQPSDVKGKSLQEGIIYAGRQQDTIDTAMRQAAMYAYSAADAYLKRAGFPDGLADRLVRWELASLYGGTSGPAQAYEGGSVALPLAIAIISEYVARAVANDIALTGAFIDTTADTGQVLPVDGILEKIEYAITTGSKIIYIPDGNTGRFNEHPSMQKLAAEHEAQVVPAGDIGQVCSKLFPPEGSGQLKDLVEDAFGNYVQIFKPILRRYRLTSSKFAYQRHYYHVLACSVLTMLLVLLESWMICKTCAPDFPSIGIWIRIIAVAVLAFVGTSFSFVLPDICLQHRERWSWIAGTILLAVCLGIGGQLLIPVIPGLKPVNSSPNILPTAFFLKDMFLIWVFTWVIAADSFNVVAGAEHLLKNRQFITARECLKWNSLLEIRMPVLCIYFPWKWGTTAVIAVALILIAWEMRFFSSILRKGSEATHQLVVIGICREFLFLVAISEVLIFYKTALANIRKMFR